MEYPKALAFDPSTTSDSNNNNIADYHSNRKKKKKKRTSSKQRQFGLSSMSNTDSPYRSRKRPLSWTKRWSKLFQSCSSERSTLSLIEPLEKSIGIRSENQLVKHVEKNPRDKKEEIANRSVSKTRTPIENHQRHHHQTNDRVEKSRRSPTSFFSPSTQKIDGSNVDHNPKRSNPSKQQQQQVKSLTRSADRLNNKSHRRELRYEEHDDYIPILIPTGTSLNSIPTQTTIDHYARTLNQSDFFPSTHRRSQIEIYQLASNTNRSLLPRPYSSNIPLLYQSTFTEIPISYSATIPIISNMSQRSADNENTYGKLSECHSPLILLENSAVKAPRRIETSFSQFPTSTTQTEPVYANTQSLYDNILYPGQSKISQYRAEKSSMLDLNEEKKSCASQTQLTWTMATFSSFVDLENQSIIIPQTDPSTLYSIASSNYHSQLATAVSPTPVEPISQRLDETHPPRSRTPTSTKVLMIEKRDGSFQTLLTIAPTHELDSGKQLFLPDSTPSPLSTGSSSTTDRQHHHRHRHHHRRHKSRSNTSRQNINTRDVGLQVNIQTVKKITFSSERSDESSLTTSATTPSQPTVIPSRELKHVQTNTEPIGSIKNDRSTSYENEIHLVTTSSQTTDSTINVTRSTKAAQTSIKSLRDQSIETNNRGLFVCDLSSLLKTNLDEISPSTSTITVAATIKRKS